MGTFAYEKRLAYQTNMQNDTDFNMCHVIVLVSWNSYLLLTFI